MPILEVEIVQLGKETALRGLAQRIADAAAAIFGCETGRVWVRLRHLSVADYAENGGLPEGIHPVFVRVLVAHLPERDVLREEAKRLTPAIAEACSRPTEYVHVIYEPAAVGRIAFGGVLREE